VADEIERKPYDLVVMGLDGAESIALAKEVLQTGSHHLLLVPCAQSTPKHALICVANGEPGKEGVLFTGRLIRHLGANATLLTVLPDGETSHQAHQRVARFLSAGVRTLQTLGVEAKTAVRNGPVHEQILAELQANQHDLLVLGAPLPALDGKISLEGPAGGLLHEVKDRSILIIRSSPQTLGSGLPLPLNEQATTM
jgi:hypothetical protein